MLDRFTRYFSDIRFWIILFFVVRLYGIWFPPLDVSHNWRQSTVCMVARNFLEIDPNPMYPRMDIAGEKTGITGMEFPLLNFIIYLFSLLFGYQHWYGRLIVLIVSSLGIWTFFRLIRKYFDPQIAFNASIVLLFSIWFTYSRKIMPDTFSMGLVLMALWQALEFLDTYRRKHLFLYIFFLLAGTLSKLPSAYIMVLLAWPFLKDTGSKHKRFELILGTVIVVSLCMFWYFMWVPYLTEAYGFTHFFMGKSLLKGSAELLEHWDQTISKFYEVAIKFIAFAFLLVGLFFAVKRRQKTIQYIFGLGFLGFLPIMMKGGFTFYHHSYYIIPFVPVMSLVSAYGIAQLKNKKYISIVLIAIGIEGTLNHMDDFRIKEEYKALLTIETVMDSFSDRHELIVVNSGAFPTPVYFTHRKGWVAFNGELKNKAFTDSLIEKGLRYIVIMKKVYGEDLELPFMEMINTPDYRIYSTDVRTDETLEELESRNYIEPDIEL